ncbi:Uncharacterized protein Adt_27637 [Abeliophyllum distichum]|uniref:Uncharacterized protein n=1 Tax=Abeliophyllum distichum TaxID=126358 RepID=A0ABD1RYD7_9LAMI
MEHLEAIEEIHRGASLNGHELYVCQTPYCNLRKRWVINIKDYRKIRRPKGYELNHHRHQPHNASWEEGHEQVPEVDSEGHIIEYVPGKEEDDPEEDEDPEPNESAGENY